MDLDFSKSETERALNWPRLGMFLCFVVAAAILLFTMALPDTAHSTAIAQSLRAS